MHGLKAKLAPSSSIGQNQYRHGEAVEENHKNSKCTEDSEHLGMSRHTSDPGHFERAQSATVSTTMISSSSHRYFMCESGETMTIIALF